MLLLPLELYVSICTLPLLLYSVFSLNLCLWGRVFILLQAIRNRVLMLLLNLLARGWTLCFVCFLPLQWGNWFLFLNIEGSKFWGYCSIIFTLFITQKASVLLFKGVGSLSIHSKDGYSDTKGLWFALLEVIITKNHIHDPAVEKTSFFFPL